MAWDAAHAERLQSQAAAPMAQPVAPPPAPAPIAPKSVATLHSTRLHLPAAVIKALRTQVEPLADTVLPAPADLRAFWQKTTAAIKSIDPSFGSFELDFTFDHVQSFGPHVLGFAGWQQVASRGCRTWAQFVKEVELVFGLSSEQLEEQFFALEKRRDESSAAFVMRVEMERRRLGMEKSATYHAFVKSLDQQTK